MPACAFNLTDVHYSPAVLTAETSPQEYVLRQDVRVDRAPCNYDRKLRSGTHWVPVGSVPEGRVFKLRDQVLTIECSNVFEAYPVVHNAALVGFYLPVEKGLVKLPEPVPLVVETAAGDSL